MTKRKEVGGVGAADFNDWKHHPVTKVLHKYLEDYRAALQRDHIERWEAGEDDPKTEHEARGRTIAARELKELSFEDLFAFYSANAATGDETQRSEEEDARTTD